MNTASHAGCDHAYGICSVPAEPLTPEEVEQVRAMAAERAAALAALDAEYGRTA